MPKLILDTSIVICWCEELEDPIVFNKLNEAGFSTIIPQRVVNELEPVNRVADHILQHSETVECDGDRHKELSDRFFGLGSGEKAVIALGEHFDENDESYYCVLDDDLARRTCEKLSLEYTGTIGLFNELINEDLIEANKADQLIRKMKEAGTWLPENHTELLEENN